MHIHICKRQRHIFHFGIVCCHPPVICSIESIYNFNTKFYIYNSLIVIYVNLVISHHSIKQTYAIRGFPFAMAHVVGPSFAPFFNNLARISSFE